MPILSIPPLNTTIAAVLTVTASAWGLPAALQTLAKIKPVLDKVKNKLSLPGAIDKQVTRMLADDRASALSTRFASQWLRLQDLDAEASRLAS